MLKDKDSQGVPVLARYDIAEGVVAFSTTRHGGASKGGYGEFNINPYCGDDPTAVAANRKALEQELGILDENLLMPHQVHGVKCLTVTTDVLSTTEEERARLLDGVDGIMTDISGVCIGVSTADCIPILLYDEPHHAVAAVHAGWRGTVQRIALAAIEKMRLAYDTRPQDLVAVIGPGISLENFEVGQEVYDEFEKQRFDMSLIAKRFPTRSTAVDGGAGWKWHIDLPLCNQLQLESAGVPHSNIIQSGICTYDRCADYFSARRLGQASGRIYSGIFLK